jgi:hypothetical protein
LLGSRPEEDDRVESPSSFLPIRAPSGDPRAEESYLLSHCQDFAVVDPRGGTGFVSDLRFLSRVDRPDELEITTGRVRPRAAWVPVSWVEHISLEREEVRLANELPWSRRTHLARSLLARVRHVPL